MTLPYDVLHQTVDADAVQMPTPEQFKPVVSGSSNEAIATLWTELTEAERPTLIAGPSVMRGAAGEALREISALTGLGIVPIDSPVGLAEPSLHGLGRALAESDLIILAARGDFAVNFLDEQTVRPGTKIAQIAPDAGSIGQNRAVDVGIVADMPTVLAQLLEVARLNDQSPQGRWRAVGWREELESRRAAQLSRTRPLETSDEIPVHPMRVTSAV
jgi:thiamine pyrophosphate-dependent acetolactate synthase large subunit-like protein